MSDIEQIYLATQNYADTINEYDLGEIVKQFANKYYSGQVYVFKYIGWLPFGINTTPDKIEKMKLWEKPTYFKTAVKPRTKFRYNIGMLSVSHGYKDKMTVAYARKNLIFHYLGFVLDNKKKEVWLLDSLSSNPVLEDDTGFVTVIKTIYPKYTIRGINVCSGCGQYEPYQDFELEEQNIFCHTWTLYFLYMIIKGIYMGLEVSTVVEYLNNHCMSPSQNLMFIKSFAKYIYSDFLAEDTPLDEHFSYIFLPVGNNLYDLANVPEWNDIEF